VSIVTAAAAALFSLAVHSPVAIENAPQVATDRTYLTFSCPTRLPGASLAPGTYLFAVLRSVGGQSLIDVYTDDASRHVARFLGVDGVGASETRPSRTADRGCEATAQPRRGWFNTPHARDIEFVYSRAEAGELSKTLGIDVPYSVLPVDDLELVGAYPVAGVRRGASLMFAGAGAMVAFPAESSRLGTLIVNAGPSFGPVDHLKAARLIVAERAGAVARERTLLQQLGALLDAVQRAAREKDTASAARLADGIAATIANLNPPSHVLAKHGILPPPRDFVVMLEQVGAHVRAFARTIPATN
jgi:hypothetical protein